MDGQIVHKDQMPYLSLILLSAHIMMMVTEITAIRIIIVLAINHLYPYGIIIINIISNLATSSSRLLLSSINY